MADKDIILEVRDLKKYFKSPTGTLHAVDGVNFTSPPAARSCSTDRTSAR